MQNKIVTSLYILPLFPRTSKTIIYIWTQFVAPDREVCRSDVLSCSCNQRVQGSFARICRSVHIDALRSSSYASSSTDPSRASGTDYGGPLTARAIQKCASDQSRGREMDHVKTNLIQRKQKRFDLLFYPSTAANPTLELSGEKTTPKKRLCSNSGGQKQ